MEYIITTELEDLMPFINSGYRIAMLDGTVPGWEPKPGDLHYDHHNKTSNAKVQIDEMPKPTGQELVDVCVSTLLDADAVVAAAYLQLSPGDLEGGTGTEAYSMLRAIAHECDHLFVDPRDEVNPDWAFKVVAAMKVASDALRKEMGLPKDRKEWSKEQRMLYYSTAFRQSVEHIIAAIRGERPFPGELAEADEYFNGLLAKRDELLANGCCSFINGIPYADTSDLRGYVDPRAILMAWAKLDPYMEYKPITLTRRSHKNGGFQYTLGTVPGHPGQDKIDLTKVFPVLSQAEMLVDNLTDGTKSPDGWGGRVAVGGSGFNTPSLLQPQEVVGFVNALIS